MSVNKIRFLILALFSALLLSSCNCTNSAVSIYEVLLDSPKDFAVLSPFDFEWHGSDSCEPGIFKMRIEENIPYGGDSKNEEINGDVFTQTFPVSYLLPGREYRWKMQAWNEYDPEATGDYWGPESSWEYFYSGPVCGSGSLIAPEIEVPGDYWQPDIDNWITHDHLQDFHWSYSGGCLPQYYDYQFATDLGFTDLVLSGTTSEDYSMHTYQTFPNCSTLFWRVRANHGGSVGPWSDPSQFHWVREGTECYQTHYVSDDAARIYVRLYNDQCTQTGYNASSHTVTDPDCIADSTENIIVADGVRTNPYDYGLGGFKVQLGSGPCPSTGLDSKGSHNLPFYVVGPGTYCVSITREQTVSYGIDLMDGVWSEPRTNDTIAYQTVEVPPLTTDITVQFGWDEWDLIWVMPEFEVTMECHICPDPIGPVTGFLMAGNPVPIYGRDYASHWKESRFNGETCYVQISDAFLDEALAKLGNMEVRSLDLEQFPAPPPCPEPDKPDKPVDSCNQYSQDSCGRYKCYWDDTKSLCVTP